MSAVCHNKTEVPYQSGIIAFLHKKLPSDHRIVLGDIEEDVIHELWEIHGDLKKKFRPCKGGMSFESYFMKFAPLKVLRTFRRRYHELKKIEVLLDEETRKCEADDKDGITRHQYGKWILPVRPSQYDRIEYRDLLVQMNEIAEMMGLKGVIPMLVFGMTEREIAIRLNIPKTTLHDKIEKLRSVMEKVFAEILK